MATLIVSEILDHLVDAVEAARSAAKNDPRWSNAIEAGYNWLIQEEVITFNIPNHELTVPSATDEGRTYCSNGSCQCKAFEKHQACWHRAASRLVRRALELQTEAQRKANKAQIVADLLECF